MRRDQEPTLKSKSVWRVGVPAAIESECSRGTAAVVLEDDGETGYLYAIDRSQNARTLAGNRTYRIVAAVHLYDAASQPKGPKMAELIWANTGTCAAAKLGGEVLAVIDFESRKSWCRSGVGSTFKEAQGWDTDHNWEPSIVDRFAGPGS